MMQRFSSRSAETSSTVGLADTTVTTSVGAASGSSDRASLGCPLSLIMGAFYLAELDEKLERLGIVYVRFMDDILMLVPTMVLPLNCNTGGVTCPSM